MKHQITRELCRVFLIILTSLYIFSGIQSDILAQENESFNKRLGYLLKLEELIINSQTEPLNEEMQIKYDWMRLVLLNAAGSNLKASRASNQAERKVWLKDAKIKADLGERLMGHFLGPDVKYKKEWEAEDSNKKLPPEYVEYVEEQIRNLKNTQDEVLVAVKKHIDKVKSLPVVDKGDIELLNIKQEQITEAARRLLNSINRAKSASTRAEVEFWLNDVKILGEIFQRTGEAIAGKEIRLKKLKPLTGFSSPILYQMKLHDEYLKERIVESDPQVNLSKAKQVYYSTGGRAGAGGVSLHKSAEVLAPLEMGKVREAVFEDGRLFLLYEDRRIAFPSLEPEYLALAIRSIYGKEGVIKGELVADEPNAVVLQTGRDRFGEMVWKKEFLPRPWTKVSIGESVGLSLGPGIGLLSQPEPSTKRVTYYGPIKNTRMGKVLLEADLLLVALFDGIDPHTGAPLAPPDIKGYMSLLERRVRRLLNPVAEEKKEKEIKVEDEKPWWREKGTTWFVWVPDKFTLKLMGDGKSFEFAEARMKLSAWSVTETKMIDEQELARHSTEHYQDLAKVFPVLKDLEEVTKAVSVVRWLKQNDIPVDPSRANDYPVREVKTPERVRKFFVIPEFDRSGKPLVEK